MPKNEITPLKSLGLRIKELRAERAITQEELAEMAGVFRTYMSRIESGLANPTFTTLYTLAQVLDVQPGDLFLAPQAKAAPAKVRSVQNLSRGRVKR